MTLLDMTTPAKKAEFLRTLPSGMRIPAWRAANPPLAAETDLWLGEVRRTARYTATTIEEVIEFTDNDVLLDLIMESERRSGLVSAARERCWNMQRQSQQASHNPTFKRDSKQVSTEALLDRPMGELAELLGRTAYYQIHLPTLTRWLVALSDEDLVLVWNTKGTQSHLINECLRRGRCDLVASSLSTLNNSNVAVALQAMDTLGVAEAQLAVQAGITASTMARCNWDNSAIEELVKLRRFDVLLQMRYKPLHELLDIANGISVDELDRLANLELTSQEIALLEDTILSLEAATGAVSTTVINRLERIDTYSQALRDAFVRYADPRKVLEILTDSGPADSEHILANLYQNRRPVLAEMLLMLNTHAETELMVALFERLLRDAHAPIIDHLGRGSRSWVTTRIAAKIAEQLDAEDWKMFFAVIEGFPGTLDELIKTVKSVRS